MSDSWTTDRIPDLTGKVIIVTGANSGIGFEAAKEFAHNGAETILACRNMEKAQAALNQIQGESSQSQAETIQLDLASLESIHRFAEEFEARYACLDVLVNNAGLMMAPYGRTEDGFELQLGTNHLGHFALTGLLVDTLLQAPGSRVVTISSMGHHLGTVDFDNLMYEQGRGYSPAGAYGRSKLANLLFTYELQRRYEEIDADAFAVAAHPGSANTNLSRYLYDRWYLKPFKFVEPLIAQSAAMGAQPTLRAATDPGVQGGQYYGPSGFLEQKGHPVVVQSNSASHDEATARRLWEISEELTGVRYTQLDRFSVS
jgi:NAD(P)-dependent dehydrogenase (short-subunit alcohol dehydrogenase family)